MMGADTEDNQLKPQHKTLRARLHAHAYNTMIKIYIS